MRILIVDDHAIVRVGIKQLLLEENNKFEFGEAGNAQEAYRMLESGKWDVILLDINLPNKNGLDVLKQIKSMYKNVPVLMLSMYPEDQYAVRALKAGASGYMTKEMTPDYLMDAIMKVTSGRRFISPELAERLAVEIQDGGGELPHTQLSDREFEIFRLIGSGKSVSEIASVLSLSVKTVSTYRTRILAKMNMRNNSEITHYAVKYELV